MVEGLFVAIQWLRSETDLALAGDLLTAEERKTLEPVKTRPSVVLTWISHRIDALARAGKIALCQGSCHLRPSGAHVRFGDASADAP